MRTYICKLCGQEIRAYAVPTSIAKAKLCAECYIKTYPYDAEVAKQQGREVK